MPGPFGTENCITGQLPPNVGIQTKLRVGMDASGKNSREVTIEIGLQTGQGNPSESCQLLLQSVRIRARLGDPTTISQDSPCLGCGRRVKSESPPKTP